MGQASKIIQGIKIAGASTAIAVLFSTSLSAISNLGPDFATTGNTLPQASQAYHLEYNSQDNSISVTDMTIIIYCDQPNTSTGSTDCQAGTLSINNVSPYQTGGATRAVWWCKGNNSCAEGSSSSDILHQCSPVSGTCPNSNQTPGSNLVTRNLTNGQIGADWVWDASLGRWTKNIRFRRYSSNNTNAVQFRLSAQGGLYVISQTAKSAVMHTRLNPEPEVVKTVDTWQMKMQLSCSSNNAVSRTINIIDLDNGNGNQGNSGYNVTWSLQTNAGVTVPLAVGGTGAGNNQTLELTATFNPGVVYTLSLANVSRGNAVEYELPNDIVADIACPWQLTNTSLVNGSAGRIEALSGATATFKHNVKTSHAAINDSGNNVRITSRVYQYVNSTDSTTKPADFDNHQFCPIADGWYSITTGAANDRAVDISGGLDVLANGNNVQSYQSNGSGAQKWWFECKTSGTYAGMYTITAPVSNSSVDTAGTFRLVAFAGTNNNKVNGANVGVWSTASSTNVGADGHWKVIKESSGFSILSYHGLSLDVAGASTVSGANIQLYTINGTAAQKWYIKKWFSSGTTVAWNGTSYTGAVPGDRITTGLPYTLKGPEETNTAPVTSSPVFDASNSLTFTTDNAGKTYCQFVRTTFTGRNNAIHLDSTPACVYVKADSWVVNVKTSHSSVCNTASATCLKPGDEVTFTHRAKASATTNAVVNFSLPADHPLAQSGAIPWTAGSTNPANNTVSWPSNTGAHNCDIDATCPTVYTETKIITQDDVGHFLCAQVTATPGGGNIASVSSVPDCVYIPYEYELTPDTDCAMGGGSGGDNCAANYGDNVGFEGRIRNSGPTKSRDADWEAFIFVVPNTDNTVLSAKSRVPPGLSIGTVYGINYRDYSIVGTRDDRRDCTVYNGLSVFSPPPDTTDDVVVCGVTNLTHLLNNLDLGDRLCFAIWVSNSWATPNEQGSTDRSYSQPSCVTVSKSPQLQLRGADAESGAARFGRTTLTGSQYEGGFIGSYSSNQERGSWSQYGLLSNGQITSFGATGYTTPDAVHLGKACKLFFANTTGNGGSSCSSDSGHGWQGVNDRVISLPAVAERSARDLDQLVSATTYQELPSTSTPIRLQDLGSGTYYVKQSLLIEASRLTRNQHLTLVAADPLNTITIAGNIDLDPDDTYDTLAEIPSLTIIADRINIQGFSTVNSQPITKLYGTYIAKERFDSCTYQYKTTPPEAWALDGVALAGITNTPLSNGAGLCREQLTITGAIISKDRPDFRRTHGASKEAPAVPSEIIQYTPNLYLTPYVLSQDGNANDWRLGDLKQLPARL